MRIRYFGATALLALVIGLVSLAHATPPDQTWLAGFWDDADFDDVVLALTSTVMASGGGSIVPVGLATNAIDHVTSLECSALADTLHAPYRLRAPPDA